MTPFLRRPIQLFGLGAALALAAQAADQATHTIAFSDPAKPGTLRIAIAHGDLRVVAADTTEVTIKSDTQSKQKPRADGLRVLTEAAGFSLSEKDNVITLDAASAGWTAGPADFVVTVPRTTNVVVGTHAAGDIYCAGITGDLEIKCVHGEVTLEDVGGGAVVETMNGAINASFQQLQPGKTISFASMNGEVLLRVPPDTRASVRLRTQNGSILTDFDEKALVTRVESAGVGPASGRLRGPILSAEAREAIREATRAGAEIARRTTEALREAAEAAREGAETGESSNHRVAKADRLPQPPIPPIPPMPAIPAVTGGKLVTGTLNGGGAEINVTTMNGDVVLRRRE